MHLSKSSLDFDRGLEIERITAFIRAGVDDRLRRRGLVVGISGGVDSAVTAALAVRALGPDRVLGLLMPERHSSDESMALGDSLVTQLGISSVTEDITATLEATGCYARQASAVRSVVADYQTDWRFKLSLPSLLDGERLNVFRLTVQTPNGEQLTRRLPAEAYLQLVAATNFKQRVRKMMEYYHADRLGYAVAGTPNRLEYDQGFFVKQGDGAADIKPIAHLYKTQVYALAEQLDVPAEIRSRPPTTDTYSLPQTQEEFYFALPYHAMDVCLFAMNHDIDAGEVATTIGLPLKTVEAVFNDIRAKRRATAYLHAPPLHLVSEPDRPRRSVEQ